MANKMFEFAFKIAGKMDSSFRSSFQNTNSIVSRTKGELAELNKTQKMLESSFKAGAINQKTYNNAMAKTNLQVKNLNATQERFNAAQRMQKQGMQGMQQYGGNMLKTVGIGAAMFLPAIHGAMKFESQMADVRKVVDFETPEQFKEMGTDIVNLSRSIPMTAEGLAEIVAAGGQAGIAREDLLQFAEGAAKMGVAFDISADEAGQMMAQWRTAFKMNQNEVTTLADQINYLSDSTAGSATKISSVVTRIGPLAEVAGVATNDLAALGATLVSMGIGEDVAATGIKNLMLGMTAGESATKQQAGAFIQLGLDATEMARRMQTDSKGAILELMNALNQLPKERQAGVLKQLFGKESIGAISPLLSNTEELAKNFAKVADATLYAGSMQKEFETRSKTTENSLQLMKNALSGVAINVGSVFLPAVTEGFQKASEIAGKMADWAAENPKLVSTIGTVAAGALGLSLAVNAVGFAYSALTYGAGSTVKGLMTSYEWMFKAKNATTGLTKAQWISTKAQWLWNAAMSAHPIALTIIGIAALIAAGYALYKNWDMVKGFFTSMWESPAVAVISFMAGPIGWLIYGGAGLIAHWDEVKVWFTTLWNEPGKAVDQFITFFKGKFDNAFSWVSDKVTWVKSLFSSPVNVQVNASAKNTGTGQQIASNALGGIYPKGAFLTTFAERSGESAVPHVRNARSLSLWEKTGEILGVKRSGNVSATYAPNITIQGDADSKTLQQIKSVLSDNLKDFENKLKQINRQQARVAYD